MQKHCVVVSRSLKVAEMVHRDDFPTPPFDLLRAAAAFKYLWDRYDKNIIPWPRSALPRGKGIKYGLTLEQNLESILAGDFCMANEAGEEFNPGTSWGYAACRLHMGDEDKAALVFTAIRDTVEPYMTPRFYKRAKHCLMIVKDYQELAKGRFE